MAIRQIIAAVLWPVTLIRSKLNQLSQQFINSRSGPFDGPVRLDSSRVYILPTRIGVIYSLLLFVLLLGSINYTKSLGYMLTFLLASLGLVAMLTTWRNLAGLQLSRAGVQPVHAGQSANFAVQLENTGQTERLALSIEHKGSVGETVDVPSDNISIIHFKHAAARRGYYDPGKFRLSTEFPLGLFVAWTWVDLSMKCLIYPKPSNHVPDTMTSSERAGDETGEGLGVEDFSGLRKFQPGDSWRRVAWKISARRDELYSKEFHGSKPEEIWIDYNEQTASSIEQKLSDMTRMVLDAQASGKHYGLRLPQVSIEPYNSIPHQHQCLKALAEYNLDNES